MNLMKSLDRIENILDKESGSSKSGIHMTLKKKGISRSCWTYCHSCVVIDVNSHDKLL
jgi:hypothetical protein